MTSSLDQALRARADRCELCGGPDDLDALPVPPRSGVDGTVLACAVCRARAAAAALDAAHWAGLRDSAWSAVPAVAVCTLRLLHRLEVPWARELREQVYLDDDARAWFDAATAGSDDDDDDDGPITTDSNGATLSDGDSVTLIQDLDVKGAGFVAKRGTLVKNIRLTGDPALIEAKVNKVTLVLKTQFLKKA